MLVRTDLSPAQQIVQACHAAHEAGIHLGDTSSVSSFVLCSIRDEESLKLAALKLESRGIRHRTFVEPVLDGQVTALATEPVSGAARKAFSSYPLWKEMQHDPA